MINMIILTSVISVGLGDLGIEALAYTQNSPFIHSRLKKLLIRSSWKFYRKETSFCTRKNSWHLEGHPRLHLDLVIFKRILKHCKIVFRNLAHISVKHDRIFMDILPEMYLCTRKYPLNFGCHPDLIRTPYVDQTCLGGHLHSPSVHYKLLKLTVSILRAEC